MPTHEKMNYVEFPAKDLAATKAFFAAVFGWTFTDYGPAYTAFADEGLDGGFFNPTCAQPQRTAGHCSCSLVSGWKKPRRKSKQPAARLSNRSLPFPAGDVFSSSNRLEMNLRSGRINKRVPCFTAVCRMRTRQSA